MRAARVRKIAAVAGLIMAFGVCPVPTWACTCRGSSTKAVASMDRTGVFIGKVLSVRTAAPKFRPDWDYSVATVRVLKSWKNANEGEEVKVFTMQGRNACGRDFYSGMTYLFFAQLNSTGEFVDGSCSPTKEIVWPSGAAWVDSLMLEVEEESARSAAPDSNS